MPAYASVTIHVDPFRLPVSTLSARLHDLSYDGKRPLSGLTHRIPVLYGDKWGPDLHDVAAFARQSLAETIRLHHTTHYRVYMLGFSPGFPYMGVVPASIAMPACPRLVPLSRPVLWALRNRKRASIRPRLPAGGGSSDARLSVSIGHSPHRPFFQSRRPRAVLSHRRGRVHPDFQCSADLM